MSRASIAWGLLLLAAIPAGHLRAAESYDNCVGTIETLPATIGSQGVWCLKADKSTAISSGAAITIAVPNVTLDCNGFKLGGLAAGAGTYTIGIYAGDKANITIRNCSVRGFHTGAQLVGSSGHLVEDNRFDSNTVVGVAVTADNYVIRNNMITQTGLSTIASTAHGILAAGSAAVIDDNLVSGVAGNFNLYSFALGAGVQVSAHQSVLRNNHVTGIYSATDTTVYGIGSAGADNKLLDNTVGGLNSPTGTRRGLDCTGDTSAVAVRNVISSASPAYEVYACTDGGGNVIH
ncbi:MAG TPA: right-handed parallel beta-helix repeat-containing protein [Lysobacter sp.]